MDKMKRQIIECDSLLIASSLETINSSEHSVYFPQHTLIYVKQGRLHLRHNQQLVSIHKDNFCLIRKHTSVTCFKTWDANEDGFRLIGFALNDEFIKKVVLKVPAPETTRKLDNNSLIPLNNNTILAALISSLEVYFNGQLKINKNIVELKTLETIIGLVQGNVDVLNIFHDYAKPTRTDLPAFMDYYIAKNLTLKELSRLSGRSLATFHRDFKDIFGISPHKWIKEQRLRLAKNILLHTDRKSSDIYLELGFKDLAHFSRSFKKYFGKNPSNISGL